MRRRGGCDVVLHGGQEVQDGLSGGPSVPGGEAHAGGAEHPAGKWLTQVHFPYVGQQDTPVG